MGIFSTSTPFDEQLNKATNELNTDTDWGLILSLCDKIKATTNGPSIFAPAILAKLNNKIPHVSMQAITVLDACVNNCGKDFQKLISSVAFMDGLRDFLIRYKNPTVTRRLRYFIKKWTEEFKEDKEMSRFVSFYYDLRAEGLEFPDTEDDNPSKRKIETSTNPDEVASQQEADDIAKAIEASLKEEQRKATTVSYAPAASLYPSMTGAVSTSYSANSHTPAPSQPTGGRKVKALYDFEAAEDNELTFKTGDIITIMDDSDVNWWKGSGANGVGLFPSNFVTSDLTKDTEEEEKVVEKKESVVKFNETLEVKEVNQSEPVLRIDEDLIDRTLATLQSTDPETTTTDPEQLIRDEESCNQMSKLIDNQLEDLDRRHLELTMLNEKILDSLKMYDNLMKQAPVYQPQRYAPMTAPGQSLTAPRLPMMAGGYPANPAYSNAYAATQAAPPAMPQQLGTVPADPSQAYNPMYQNSPSNTYLPAMVSNPPTVDQQGAVLPNPQYQSNPSAQNSMSYGSPQLNPNYQETPQITSQYQNPPGLVGGAPPTNYSTNHVSSQPLM